MEVIQMVDLQGQYRRLQSEIDDAIKQVLADSRFVMGPAVADFQSQLAQYARSRHVITCGNGTDALQIALMALGLQPGDEVITVPFTFFSTAEVIRLLHLTPVFVDVRYDTFTMDVDQIENAITPKTKAIVPVHLFGQCADMEAILQIAKQYGLFVVEDACQAIGATVTFSDGMVRQAGTMGDVGCLSFFPSKNLGCYGDGGALFTQNDTLALRIQQIANHGSIVKYHHDCIGVNSRLDAIQAAVLSVKLKYLDDFTRTRQQVADFYTQHLKTLKSVKLPVTAPFSSHVFHQFTLKLTHGNRNTLQQQLKNAGIPTMIYYPTPVHLQPAFADLSFQSGDYPVSEKLADQVLSLPMHTEMTEEQLFYIIDCLTNFLK